MIITSDYETRIDDKGYIHIRSREQHTCPICQGEVYVIGSRRRVLTLRKEKKTLIIRRLRCKNCKTVHHELPDVVVPYKRHGRKTIETIINGENRSARHNCTEGTAKRIRNWWQSVYIYFQSILTSLAVKYNVAFSGRMVLREIVRAIVNANLWPHTHSAFLPRNRS
jgi:hypothetical protein